MDLLGLGFAHSYASDSERDQAISAYYSASKFMPGSHLPYLYLGLEYSLSHNIKLAKKFYKEALLISPEDFHVQMELGCLAYQSGEFTQAEVYFIESLRKIKTVGGSTGILEPLYNNLGHVSRKLKKYDEAITYHRNSLSINPKSSNNYSSIGLCYFLKRDFENAVKNCHKALGLKRHDTFTIQLLEQAIDCYSHSCNTLMSDAKEIVVNSEDSKLSSSIDLSCTSNNVTSEAVDSSTNKVYDSSRMSEDSSMMSMDMSNDSSPS